MAAFILLEEQHEEEEEHRRDEDCKEAIILCSFFVFSFGCCYVVGMSTVYEE